MTPDNADGVKRLYDQFNLKTGQTVSQWTRLVLTLKSGRLNDKTEKQTADPEVAMTVTKTCTSKFEDEVYFSQGHHYFDE